MSRTPSLPPTRIRYSRGMSSAQMRLAGRDVPVPVRRSRQRRQQYARCHRQDRTSGLNSSVIRCLSRLPAILIRTRRLRESHLSEGSSLRFLGDRSVRKLPWAYKVDSTEGTRWICMYARTRACVSFKCDNAKRRAFRSGFEFRGWIFRGKCDPPPLGNVSRLMMLRQ